MKKEIDMETAVGLCISSPKQAMEIIKGLLEVAKVASIAFNGIAKLLESGDTEKALELLKQGSDAIAYRTSDVLKTHAIVVTGDELAAALEKQKGDGATITPTTKCAGNA